MEITKEKYKEILKIQMVSYNENSRWFTETLAEINKALQLQKNSDNGSFCSNCRWLNGCAIRIDNNIDTCEEHEY